MRPRSVERVLTCLALAASVAGPARAGAMAKMGDAIQLQQVRNKVLVLEFDNPPGQAWGRDIANLLAQAVLGSTEGVPSFGVVSLSQPEKRLVLDGPRVDSLAREQRARVTLWGEFLSDREQVYLRIHLRLMSDSDDAFSDLRLTTFREGNMLTASPPTRQVNFAPVAIPRALLEQLHTMALGNLTLVAEPREGARAVNALRLRNSYFLAGRRGAWTLVQTKGGPPGWVRLDVLTAADHAPQLAPVIHFAQGALQVMAGNRQAGTATLRRYLDQEASGQDTMNRALANLLLAVASYHGNAFEPTERPLLEVARLLPNSAAAANYLAVARLYEDRKPSRADLEDTERRLIAAVRRDGDPEAIRNLSALYAWTGPRLLLKDPHTDADQYRAAVERQVRGLVALQRGVKPPPS